METNNILTLPVSVLFVRKDSIYKQMKLDCWDFERDATKYDKQNPVIAHPPCRAWGQLSHMAKPRPGEKELAFFAIDTVRKFGGILEHPRASRLWPYFLPLPGKVDQFGGYTISVDQHWWGHKAKKSTLLYIVGVSINDLPPIPLRFELVEYTISTTSRSRSQAGMKEVSKKEREATPPNFAKWLIEVASMCKPPINQICLISTT